MKRLAIILPVLVLTACAKAPKPVPDDGNIVQIYSEEGGKTAMDRRIATAASGVLVHVISLYEASISHMGAGDATITIDDQGSRKVALVLASYEAVDWHIEGPGAQSVTKVYLSGMKRHSVDGVPNATVINRSGPEPSKGNLFGGESDYGGSGYGGDGSNEDLGFGSSPEKPRRIACALTYAAPDGGGCEAGKALVAQAMPKVGGSFATYTGIYNGSKFRIKRWPGS